MTPADGNRRREGESVSGGMKISIDIAKRKTNLSDRGAGFRPVLQPEGPLQWQCGGGGNGGGGGGNRREGKPR